MRRFLWPVFVGAFSIVSAFADGPVSVVASLREYREQGASGVHLYLYDGAGKLQRQLTNDSSMQDTNPCFSADGKQVFFHRSSTNSPATGQDGDYNLDLASGKLTKTSATTMAAFAPTLPTLAFSGLLSLPDGPSPSIASPDHRLTLIRKGADWPYAYFLQSTPSAKPVTLSAFRGYVASDDGDEFFTAAKNPFLQGPGGYGALFMERHPDSVWACDTRARKFYQINPDSSVGDIFATTDEPGFFFVHCNMMYLGSLDVWCGVLEFWDAHFQRTVFGPPLSVCYGATAFYGAGKTFNFLDPQRGS